MSSGSPRSIVPRGMRELKAWISNPPMMSSRNAPTNAFLVGYTLNYVLDSLLPTILRKKSASQALKGLCARSAIQGGAVLSLYSLFYKLLLKHLTRVRLLLLDRVPSPDSQDLSTHRSRVYARLIRTLRSAFLVPFAAALAASPIAVFFPNASLRQSFSLWTFCKGIESVFVEAKRSDSRMVRWVPDWVGGAFFYAIGNGQLLYAFLFEPQSFPESYGKVIMARSTAYVPPRPSGLPASIPWPAPRQIVDNIAELSTPTRSKAAFPPFSAPLLSALTPSTHPTTTYPVINLILDYSPAHPAHTALLCAVLHPTEPSCSRNFGAFFLKEWVASARFFAAFAAISQALKWRKVVKDPETALLKFVLATVQGATVISGSIGTAWAMICFWQKWLPRSFIPRFRYFLNGLLSSVFILAVPPARRAELGSYVARLSMTSTWDVLRRQGKVKSHKNGDIVLLALGMGMLAALHEHRPRALVGSVKRGLSVIIGKPDEPAKAFLSTETDEEKVKSE